MVRFEHILKKKSGVRFKISIASLTPVHVDGACMVGISKSF